MVFSSTVFLCDFLPVVLLVYYLCPPRFRNGFLLLASLVFYAWGEPVYILVMLFSTGFDYGMGRWMDTLSRKEKPAVKKAVLSVTIVVNLGLLCFFKYTDFFLENLNRLTGSSFGLLEIALPIGISFYSFQALSYVIDVYRGTVKVQRSLVNFAMYISLFPQLIAGPIVRYADIEPQIEVRKVTEDQFVSGIFRFTAGLGKKVLLANQIGVLWNDIAAAGGPLPMLMAWLGAAAFAFQIYFDFSGYSDMAIGLGRMLGFSFPENFHYPYVAKSITEFWRRWHISLSSWFRDYLYIPLGGNRLGLPRQIGNLLIVWSLTGLWHGARWNFVLWGLYYFVILVLEKLLFLRLLEKCPNFIRHFYTIILIFLGWVIFAMDDLGELLPYIRSLLGFGTGFCSSMTVYYLLSNASLLLVLALGSTGLPRKAAVWAADRLHLGEKARFAGKAVGTLAVLLCSIGFLVGDTYNPFLYFRF